MGGPLDILFNCRNATREMSHAMDASLPWTRRLALRVHVAMCASCQCIENQFQLLRDFARGLGESEIEVSTGLSAESKAKMKQRLAGEKLP